MPAALRQLLKKVERVAVIPVAEVAAAIESSVGLRCCAAQISQGGAAAPALPGTDFARADVRQIRHRPVGLVFLQFLELCAASGNGQDFGANRLSAADVERCVADYDHFLAPQSPAQHAMAAVMRGGGDEITFLVVIGEPAELELFPQPEVTQLDFRAETDVAGEQADDRRFWQRAQIAQEFPDAGTDLGFAAHENLVEPEDVILEEAPEIFRRGGNVVVAEKFADEADVGAPGELHFFQAVVGFEFGGKGLGESLRAGVARVDERAVNVEQNQFYHARKISEQRNPARF